MRWQFSFTIVGVGSVSLRHCQSIDRHEAQGLNRPKVGIHKACLRIPQAPCAHEKDLRAIDWVGPKLFDNDIL